MLSLRRLSCCVCLQRSVGPVLARETFWVPASAASYGLGIRSSGPAPPLLSGEPVHEKGLMREEVERLWGSEKNRVPKLPDHLVIR